MFLVNISDMIFNDTSVQWKISSNIITNISNVQKKPEKHKAATNAIIKKYIPLTEHIFFSIKLYIPQTVSNKFVVLIHSIKFLSPELALYLYQFIISPWSKYYCRQLLLGQRTANFAGAHTVPCLKFAGAPFKHPSKARAKSAPQTKISHFSKVIYELLQSFFSKICKQNYSCAIHFHT